MTVRYRDTKKALRQKEHVAKQTGRKMDRKTERETRRNREQKKTETSGKWWGQMTL